MPLLIRTSAHGRARLDQQPLTECGVVMPKGILEIMLSGEGIIVPHVQPMYRLNDNRLMSLEYLARYLDDEGHAHPVGPMLQDPALRPEDRLTLDLKFLESTRSEEHTSELQSLRHLV